MVAEIYNGDSKDNTETGLYFEMYGRGGNDTLSSNIMTTESVKFVELYGGTGDDNLNYYGSGQSKIRGQKGDDLLYGGISDDVIIGGKGNDYLYGGTGSDKLKGGKGSDNFVFNTTPYANNNIDKIVDFNTKDDFLHFSHSIYTSGYVGVGHMQQDYVRIGRHAKDSDDYFGYNPKKGIVWYDYNANEKGGFQEVAHVDKHLSITYYHFMFD